MIRVLVNGSNGKMGQEVIKLISKSSEFYLFGGLDKCKKDNLNYRIYSSITDLKHLNDKPDVIVDFSVPDASLAVLSYAKSIKIPIVIATTGFSNDNQKLINECSKNIPIFQSANMSFDINIMKNTVANLATLSEYLLPLVKVNGRAICMKGPGATEEISGAKNAIKLLGGKIQNIYEFELPHSDIERCVIEITKEKNIQSKYPRKAGTPAKDPLK